MDELTNEEISQTLGIKKTTVAKQIERAKKMLQQKIKAVIILILATILMSSLLLTNEEIRANTWDRLVRWLNEIVFLEFRGSEEGSRQDIWFPTYIPDGFTKIFYEILEGDYGTTAMYTSNENELIIFGAGWMFWLEEGTQVDRGVILDSVDDYSIINHDGIEYHIFISQDPKTFATQIYWEYGGFEFQVLGSIDTDTALRMAFSVTRE